jgi:hypothetical protein
MRRVAPLAAILATVALCSVGTVGAAHAQDGATEEAREYLRAGNGFFRIGDYQSALRQYAAGYEKRKSAVFLLNMGQCYRKLGDIAGACQAFTMWSGAAKADDPKRAQVEAVIAALHCHEEPAHADAEPLPAKPPEPTPVTLPKLVPNVAPNVALDVKAAPPRRTRLKRGGIALVALGAAEVVVGGTLLGLALQANRTVADPPPGWVYDAGFIARRDAMYPSGIVLCSIGIASVASGAALLGLARGTAR